MTGHPSKKERSGRDCKRLALEAQRPLWTSFSRYIETVQIAKGPGVIGRDHEAAVPALQLPDMHSCRGRFKLPFFTSGGSRVRTAGSWSQPITPGPLGYLRVCYIAVHVYVFYTCRPLFRRTISYSHDLLVVLLGSLNCLSCKKSRLHAIAQFSAEERFKVESANPKNHCRIFSSPTWHGVNCSSTYRM